MNAEDIARRFSRRAGFRLAAYRPAALPLFRLTLRVQTLVRKELPPIMEFSLRAVAGDLDTPEEIAGILGLGQRIVNDAVTALIQSDCVVIGVVPGTRNQRLVLTAKGNQTLEQAAIIMPEEERLAIFVDGLTRRISVREETIIRPRDVGEAGLLELPAHPQRKPRIDELALADLKKLVGDKRPREGESLRDVIALLGIESSERFFREDALLLVYRAIDREETQFAVVLDGHLSEEHEAALRRANRARQIKLVPDSISMPPFEGPPSLNPDLLGGVVATEETTDLHAEMGVVEQEASDLREKLKVVDSPTERTLLRGKLGQAEDRIKQLQAHLDSMIVRQLEVYEHPQYLREAMETASRRLLIVSPWIRAKVVNDEFLKRLEAALARGVEVYIGYGLEGEGRSEKPRDMEIARKLKEMADRFPNFHLSYFGDTHAKVLAYDDRFVINTSFNWLSFLGNPSDPFRDERGTYVGIPAQVDSTFEFYLKRFD